MASRDPYPTLDDDEVSLWIDYSVPTIMVRIGSRPPRTMTPEKARKIAGVLDTLLSEIPDDETYGDEKQIATRLRDLADEVDGLADREDE